MFDHVKFGVRDHEVSKAFYLKALEPIGLTVIADYPGLGVELGQRTSIVTLILYKSDEKTAPLHIAFLAESREQVDAFHAAALEAGAQDNGPPGLRPEYSGRYYAAFVLDPDGHNIEMVYHEPEA